MCVNLIIHNTQTVSFDHTIKSRCPSSIRLCVCLSSLLRSFENFDKHTSLKDHPYIGTSKCICHYIINHYCVYMYVDVWPLKNKPGDNGMPSYVAYVCTVNFVS